MKSIITSLLVFLQAISAQSQADIENIKDSIVREGKQLYRSEMASWYGTDLFMEKFKDQLSNARGYFSYDEGKLTKCIFFNKDESPKVMASFIFDSTFSTETAKIDDKAREFTQREKDIYAIRKQALEIINSDTLFKVYENTNLNLIPLVGNGEKKVYVLTGPKSHGVVIIGNDYLLTFDDQNKIKTKRQLHKNIIPISYEAKNGQTIVQAIHTHLPETGDFIAATDVCTLMMYQKFAKWKQHIVVGEKYVSLWDCEKSWLNVLTRAAWDKVVQSDN
jgi:hypothetical protein